MEEIILKHSILLEKSNGWPLLGKHVKLVLFTPQNYFSEQRGKSWQFNGHSTDCSFLTFDLHFLWRHQLAVNYSHFWRDESRFCY